MQGIVSRRIREPAPNDIIINGVGYMLGSVDKSSKLVGTIVQSMSPTVQGEYSYSALDPNKEATVAWTKLTGGFGHRYVNGDADMDKYYWALGVDCSIANAIQNGPLITTITPATVDSTNGGTADGFFEGNISGTKNLFVLNGRYCLVRTDDSAWGVSKDFGSGKVSKDVVVHTQNTGAGGTTYAYVAMGDSELIWRYDFTSTTTTWTQHASLYALCWAKKGAHLYRAHSTNLVAFVDLNTDPWTAGNWTAANSFRIGDATSAIVKMKVHPDGTLFILKTDGVYVLREDGSDVQLYAGTKFTPNGDNGLFSYLFDNWIHVTYQGSHYRIAPGGGLDPIGPERASENDSDVRGYITAGVGTPWGAVAAIYNPDSGNSYIMKYGSWDVGADGIDHFREAWHGSISSRFASQKIKAMTRSTVGAAANHERIYFINSAGAISWYLLNCVPNPSACSNYAYTTASSSARTWLFLPIWTGGYPIDNKAIRWAAFTASSLGAGSGYVLADGYLNENITPGTDGLATGTGFVGLNTDGVAALPGTKGEVWVSSGQQVGIGVAWQLRFYNSVNSAGSVVLTSFGFGYQLRPRITLTYEVMVLADDNLIRTDGSPLRLDSDQIRLNLLTFATRAGSYTCYLPPELSPAAVAAGAGPGQELTCIDYQETMAWDRRTAQWRSAIRLLLMQSQPELINYGSAYRTLGS